jgi:signal transduction histidine kinase
MIIWPAGAFASTYGGGGYGQCAYNSGCPTAQHTITTTPAGLEVAVNLVDGQTVPADGYTIVVTPLNGSGSSFTSADFYVDNTLAQSKTPDQDGAARWFWDPAIYPGTHIKVVTTDQSGQTATQEFTVALKQTAAFSGNSGPAISSGTAAGTNQTGLKHLLHRLPPPVVFVFPYLLFLLLLVELLLLITEARREVRELGLLRTFIEQANKVSALKQTFLQLASHYLRTPLTILRSGAEGLGAEGVPASITGPLGKNIEVLHQTTEALVNKLSGQATVVPSASLTAALPKFRTRQAVVVWVPVVAIGIITACFVYLANNYSRFSANALDIITQIAAYTVLVLFIYQLWRQRRLRQRDIATARAVLGEQEADWQARDQLIEEASSGLQTSVDATRDIISRLPASGTSQKFVRKGFSELAAIHARFVTATKLKGVRSTAPFEAVGLNTLFQEAVAAGAQTQANTNAVSIAPPDDVQISTREPNLLVIVLSSLLDNAVQYSPTNGSVETGGQAEANHIVITVADHGSGIPPEQLANLFKPFTKAEGAETFNHEGMGFSLYLDKLIMTYLGGDISLASTPGSGTTATLEWAVLA